MKNSSALPPKKHIITIAGRPGSGKSTTAKLLANELDFDHFSSGDLFRALGRERGVDVLEANKKAGVVEELDRLVDSKLQEIGRDDDNLVIDSRTAWHWIPDSFKIFLDLDMETAARRILAEISEERMITENIVSHPGEYAKLLQHRLDIEAERYKALYNINPYDLANYDLVVNTAENNIEEVVKLVSQKFRAWLNS
ncbi:MAG TPA: nucleoside monophosphate kinase [Candidatus Saccharimonadales bacterium]|nr:nucleoside monophosphate kinase [Candidatus Saccharimonadales bacterium]